jgi:MSHA pilin protein MshC
MSLFIAPENRLLLRRCRVALECGFTLIELLMVMVMMGVLAVVAAPRIFNIGDFAARGFHDETLSLLRYAQKTAVVQRRSVCIQVNDPGITLTMDTKATPDGVCNGPVNLPNTPRGGSGLSASTTSGAVTNFKFNSLGATDQTGAITLSITNSTAITVEADTGYVHD